MCNQSIDVLYFLIFQLFQCTTQLIRTRSSFRSTADAIKTSDNIVNLLTTNQFANALKIAVTTTNKEYLLDYIILIGRHVN